MHAHTRHATVAAVAVLLLGTVVVPGAVGAQTDESDAADELFADEGSLLEYARGLAAGLQERVTAIVSGTLGDQPDGDTLADEATTAFNERAGDFQAYANQHTNASTDYDVIAVEFHQDDDTATRYVVATVSNSSYEDVAMMSSTNRSVDQTCTLRESAARNAADEIATFHTRFVTSGQGMTTKYMSRMAAKYGSPFGEPRVDCTFME